MVASCARLIAFSGKPRTAADLTSFKAQVGFMTAREDEAGVADMALRNDVERTDPELRDQRCRVLRHLVV
jgi:hypothetical protein